MVEKSLVKSDVLNKLGKSINEETSSNSSNRQNNQYKEQFYEEDHYQSYNSKPRKRNRRRRPPKSEKNADKNLNELLKNNSVQNTNHDDKQNDGKKLQNSLTENFKVNLIDTKNRNACKSHSISISDQTNIPSRITNNLISSTSSSSRSIDKNSDKFVHTVCGGFSKETFRKKRDLLVNSKDDANSRSNSSRIPPSESQQIIRNDFFYKNWIDSKLSQSLPNSIGDKSICKSSLVINGNNQLDEKFKNFHHNEQIFTNGNKPNFVKPLMPTEPLMSVNVNFVKTDLTSSNYYNNDNSNWNKNELEKHQQKEQKSFQNESNKIADQIIKLETEFEKNYVFKMKKQLKNNEQAKYQCEICNYLCNSVDIVNKHINGPIHKNNLETMRLELRIRDLELPSEGRLKQLSSYLIQFYNKHIISEEQLKCRYDIFYQFKRKFLEKHPKSLVNIYGSMAYGICSNDTGCDIEIDFENQSKSHSQVLKDVNDVIKNEMSDVFEANIANSKTNKSQISHSTNKITFVKRKTSKNNIVFNFTSGLFATAYKTSTLIKAYFELDERVKLLAFSFRYIAKIAQIDKVDLCTLPPHAYILMTIYFLQKLNPPILPVLHEIIDSKKINRTSKTSVSKNIDNTSVQKNANENDINLLYDFDSNEESDDEEKDSIENFDVFKSNLQVYLKSKIWKIKNNEELGSLWLKLLAFYSIDFGFKKNFISIRSIGRVSKSEVKMYTKKMAIEDPFLLKQSLSRNLMTQTNKHIIYVISKACLYFVNNTRNLKCEEKEPFKNEKIVDKLISDTGIHEAKKRNKSLLEINNDDNFDDNDEIESDQDLNTDEIDEDIFELDDIDFDGNLTAFNSLEQTNGSTDFFNSNNEKESKINKNTLVSKKRIRKSKSSESDWTKDKENLDQRLRDEIDQKLTLISAIDTILTAPELSSIQDNQGIVDFLIKDPKNKTDNIVRACLEDLIEKVVKFHDSVYDEMPNITLNMFASYPTYNVIECFKLTLSSLNLPKCPPKICSMCNKEGHLERDCPQDFLPELEELPKITENWKLILNSVCKHIMNENQQSNKEVKDRNLLLEKIKTIVCKRFPEAKLSLFGSSNNGFGMKKSDLDICLTLDKYSSSEKSVLKKIIRILGALFRRESEFDMVEERINAKVPIVKFRHKKSDVEGDISLYNTLALQNTDLLRSYAEIDERTKILGHVVKYFAKICRIGDASCGSLSSYAYIIMVIHYLMNTSPPVLPCLQKLNKENFSKKETNLNIDGWDCWFNKDIKNLAQTWPHYKSNKQSIGELWLGFLRYYIEVFDWDENVVSIRDTDVLTRRSKNWTKHRLAIEDPFELSHNLAAGVSPKMGLYILKSFAKARYQFGNVVDDFRSEEIRLNIEYFFNPKSLVDGILPMGRNCFTCLKIGHQTKDCPVANNNRKEKNQGRRIYSESADDNGTSIVCYRCRKTGHMVRDCQEINNEKRSKQATNNNNNQSAINNNLNNQKTNNYVNDRCFSCNGFGHLSRDCKSTVVFTSKNANQQVHFMRQPANQQQSAPLPKIIRIDHVPQTRHVNPPILLQSGEEKYHIVVNKNTSNDIINSNSDQSNKNKIDTQNVINNYQSFFQSQKNNIQNFQQHQQIPNLINRQNIHPTSTQNKSNNNNNKNGNAANNGKGLTNTNKNTVKN